MTADLDASFDESNPEIKNSPHKIGKIRKLKLQSHINDAIL